MVSCLHSIPQPILFPNHPSILPSIEVHPNHIGHFGLGRICAREGSRQTGGRDSIRRLQKFKRPFAKAILPFRRIVRLLLACTSGDFNALCRCNYGLPQAVFATIAGPAAGYEIIRKGATTIGYGYLMVNFKRHVRSTLSAVLTGEVVTLQDIEPQPIPTVAVDPYILHQCTSDRSITQGCYVVNRLLSYVTPCNGTVTNYRCIPVIPPYLYRGITNYTLTKTRALQETLQPALQMADLIGEMAKRIRVQCPRCGALLDKTGYCSKCGKGK